MMERFMEQISFQPGVKQVRGRVQVTSDEERMNRNQVMQNYVAWVVVRTLYVRKRSLYYTFANN